MACLHLAAALTLSSALRPLAPPALCLLRLAALVTLASTRLTAFRSRTLMARWLTLCSPSLVLPLAGLLCLLGAPALVRRPLWRLALLALRCRLLRRTVSWRRSCRRLRVAALVSSALASCLTPAPCLGVLVLCTSTSRLLLSSLSVRALALRALSLLLAAVLDGRRDGDRADADDDLPPACCCFLRFRLAAAGSLLLPPLDDRVDDLPLAVLRPLLDDDDALAKSSVSPSPCVSSKPSSSSVSSSSSSSS